MQLIHIDPVVKEDDTLRLKAWLNNKVKHVSQNVNIELQPENNMDVKRVNAISPYVRIAFIRNGKEEKMLISLKKGDTLVLPKNVTFDLDYFYILNQDGTVKKFRYELHVLEGD